MASDSPARYAEAHLQGIAAQLTDPRPRECLYCYLHRMVEQFGCDNTLRWVWLWRDRQAPRASALIRRLQSRGGFCDCEVLLNACPGGSYDEDELAALCLGVSRLGSTQPCAKR